MANVRVTDRALCIVKARHKATDNRGFIYCDSNVGRRGEIRWYRVLMVGRKRLAHSTMNRQVAETWIADMAGPSDEFEVEHIHPGI